VRFAVPPLRRGYIKQPVILGEENIHSGWKGVRCRPRHDLIPAIERKALPLGSLFAAQLLSGCECIVLRKN
jgi:hypothetical protein